MLTIKPLDNSVSINDFQSYVDTVRIIPLETKEESFIINVSKLLLTSKRNYVILNSANILMFDKDGMFKFRIGKPGTGPGEYLRIVDICISEDEEKLLVLDCYNQVLIYSLLDGHFIKNIKPKWKGKESTFDGICPSQNAGFFLFSSNPPIVDNFESDFFCVGEFDSSGNLLSESFPRKDFCFSPDRFSRSYDSSIFMRPLEGDNILYRVLGGSISSVMKIDFGELSIPCRYIFSFPGNAWLNISEYIKSPFFKLPMGFLETNNYFYFWCGGPQGKTNEFLLNKGTYDGISWKSSDNFPFNFIASDSTAFYAIYNNVENNDSINNSEMSPLKEYIRKYYKLKNFSYESNPSIIKISFINIDRKHEI